MVPAGHASLPAPLVGSARLLRGHFRGVLGVAGCAPRGARVSPLQDHHVPGLCGHHVAGAGACLPLGLRACCLGVLALAIGVLLRSRLSAPRRRQALNRGFPGRGRARRCGQAFLLSFRRLSEEEVRSSVLKSIPCLGHCLERWVTAALTCPLASPAAVGCRAQPACACVRARVCLCLCGVASPSRARVVCSVGGAPHDCRNPLPPPPRPAPPHTYVLVL